MPRVGELDVFHGELSDALARIYVRLPFVAMEHRPRLSGYVRGPFCAHSRTLPSTSSITELDDSQNRETGHYVLASAVVPDPCFWTPQLPMLYDVRVEVLDTTHRTAVVERTIGMRRLGPLGRSLKLEGKRWVVRGVADHAVKPASPGQWRHAAAAMIASAPNDSLCEACSREGVLLVARTGLSRLPLKTELRRLSAWAAVGIVVLESDAESLGADDMPAATDNTLLAQHVPAGRPVVPSPWADLLACEVDEPETLAGRIADCALPILALRKCGRFAALSQARSACDQLQRDLAPFADFAGYLVI